MLGGQGRHSYRATTGTTPLQGNHYRVSMLQGNHGCRAQLRATAVAG